MSDAKDTTFRGRALSGGSDSTGRRRGDAASEFFAVGTPLHALRASYIRRPADELFFEALLAGRYAHVIAPDQSGKSSLIASTSARLENNGIRVAVLDLEQLGLRDGGTDAGRFYYSVAYRILRQLRIRFELQSWWQDKAMFSNRQRLHEFYSEVVLRQTKHPVVILIDEIQCVEHLPFTDQLLTSVRSAHDARTTDPEFTRLTFALCGECDPSTLVESPEASPFQVTQSIPLRDFTREETDLYRTELNLSSDAAQLALDRIYHWANGQPYLTQKLARAVAREAPTGDAAEFVDGVVLQQFTGRAALTNEPLLNHVHRRVLDDSRSDQLLNLYGRIRKGVEVQTDLGSGLQRRLIALGLLTVADRGDLEIRNRIFADVFTARWANENLNVQWRVPAMVAAALLLFLAIPFWYTQWLPGSYVEVLTDPASELDVAETAWVNLRSFPGHTQTADNLYRLHIEFKARDANTIDEINAVTLRAAQLPDAGNLPDVLLAAFHDRESVKALRYEDRDRALIEALDALVVATPRRRQRAAALISNDYPELIATLSAPPTGRRIYNASEQTISDLDGSSVRQWSLAGDELRALEPWSITALEVTPLVRRIVVDREGTVSRAGLTLNLSHARHNDLRIKIIAPSGKTLEIETGRERSSNVDDIRIPASQLADLRGESLTGTWSLSIRDEDTGVAGHLVGWNLTLNSQGLVEDFQRGLDIPDPVEVPATNIWASDDGRYAVARATQSDSARVWDLAFGKPIRAVAVSQGETLIGLDAGARRLLTATLDSVNVWDTATGDRVATLPVKGAGLSGTITRDGRFLFLNYPGDDTTRFELWSLDTLESVAELSIAGSPALVSVDTPSRRLAVADFDRSVRVWDLDSGALAAQLDLAAQPSQIQLATGGNALGAVYSRSGVSLWALDGTAVPLFEILDEGEWQLEFMSSGTRVVAGRPGTGYRVYEALTGRSVGPPVGLAAAVGSPLSVSADESTLLTGTADNGLRFWRAPPPRPVDEGASELHAFWRARSGSVVTATPDIRKLLIGDREGHLHVVPRAADPLQLSLQAAEELAFLGHSAPIAHIATSNDSLWAATAATDGSLRVWSLTDGLPKAWVADIPSGIADVAFSPAGHVLAVRTPVADGRIITIDRASGEVLSEFSYGPGLTSFAFVGVDTVYAGSNDGTLFRVQFLPGASPDSRRVWKGDSALLHLAAGPRDDELIVVDVDNTARALSIAEGRVARLGVVLPARVREVAVAPSGVDVMFRTERWVHKVSSAPDGLIWRDARLIPPVGPGRHVFFDSAPGPDGRPFHAQVTHFAVDRVSLRPLISVDEEPGLFGNRQDLVQAWSRRLGADPIGRRLVAPAPAAPDAQP